MTYPEVLVWQRLRGGKLGVRFRRQHPLGSYVADFFCAERALVVEIDGQVHDGIARAGRDAARDAFMRDNGFGVIRIAAADVLRDVDDTVAAIASRLARPLHRPSDGPPPRVGEDP